MTKPHGIEPHGEAGPQIINRVQISMRGQKAFLGIRTACPKIRGEFICEGCCGRHGWDV